MTPAVTPRPRARLDLLEQFVYFGEQDGVELAEPLYDSGIRRLKGLRRAPVRGFESHLVFYLPPEAGIDLIRVLHGARDIDNIFAEEER